MVSKGLHFQLQVSEFQVQPNMISAYNIDDSTAYLGTCNFWKPKMLFPDP